MKGKCQSNGKTFLRKLLDLWYDPAGGYRDVSLTDIQTVFIGKKPDKPDQVIIVIHRLTTSHDHNVGDTLSRGSLDPVDLIQHLRRT